MKGYVYVLSNPAMPGFVKIGRTTRSVAQRCDELFVTGVPVPFEVVAEVLAPDCVAAEQAVHRELQSARVADNREFFRVTAEDAQAAIRAVVLDQVSAFVAEFLDGWTIAEDNHVCGATVNLLCDRSGIDPGDFPLVAGHLTAQHLREAEQDAATKYKFLAKKLSAKLISRGVH